MSVPFVITDKKFEEIRMITKRHQDLVRDFERLQKRVYDDLSETKNSLVVQMENSHKHVHRNTEMLHELFAMIGEIQRKLEHKGTATIFTSAMVEQTKLKRFKNDEI